MSVEIFLRQYKYERGVPFLDGWRDCRESHRGDCDDFAYSLGLELEGEDFWKALSAGRMKVYHVSSRRNWSLKGIFGSHAVLWHEDWGYIDSTVREWRPTMEPHSKRWRQPVLWCRIRVIWGEIYDLFS